MDISIFIAICRELEEALPGARIVDMAEGGSGEICITLKKPGKKVYLIACPRPDMPRIYLGSGSACRSKSLTPSAQAIRNHIAGFSVVSVVQEGLERMVTLGLARKGREGLVESSLVYEMAGKKPNLIVLDGSGRVLVAQTYVSLSDGALRPVLPGLMYAPPPRPGKLTPFGLTAKDLAGILKSHPEEPADKALFNSVGGISPLLAREAATLAGGGRKPETLHGALMGLIERVTGGPYSPRIIHAARGPVLAAFGLSQFEGSPADSYDSMSVAAEAYFALLTERKRFEAGKREIKKDAAKRLESARNKLASIRKDIARSGNAETYTLYGNLLMAQLKSVPESSEEVVLTDLFSEDGAAVTVPLDARLSPVKNAERYFSMARKAVSGARVTAERLASTEKEVAALESLLKEIERAESMEELELISGHWDTAAKKGRARKGEQRARTQLPGFTSSDGYEVLYAKNAKSNDALTFKLAEPMDLWLHAQGYHGAHVIVRNPDRRPDIPLNTILEAAAVAAYFSDARKDSSVPVDYTFKKYVRKPRDPVSGQAIFTQNKTVFVDPKKPEPK